MQILQQNPSGQRIAERRSRCNPDREYDDSRCSLQRRMGRIPGNDFTYRGYKGQWQEQVVRFRAHEHGNFTLLIGQGKVHIRRRRPADIRKSKWYARPMSKFLGPLRWPNFSDTLKLAHAHSFDIWSAWSSPGSVCGLREPLLWPKRFHCHG